MPFGDKSYNKENLGFLTMENVLMDFHVLLKGIKASLNITKAPVIAVGGSYGAILAIWLRMKYP
jgi:hypothetical protein